MAAALEPYERAEAEKRMKAGKAPPVTFTEGGNATDKVADAVGMNRTMAPHWADESLGVPFTPYALRR